WEPGCRAWVPTRGPPAGRDMACRQFRRAHSSFLDDTLSGVETIAMQPHISECPLCAQLEYPLRRSLMLARSAPPVAPSAEFASRLASRMASARALSPRSAEARPTRRRRTVAASASMLLVAMAATATIQGAARPAPVDVVTLASVVVCPPAIP